MKTPATNVTTDIKGSENVTMTGNKKAHDDSEDESVTTAVDVPRLP